jgi:hypothetical protein
LPPIYLQAGKQSITRNLFPVRDNLVWFIQLFGCNKIDQSLGVCFRLKDFPIFKKDWDKIRERTALSMGILQDTIGGQVNFSRTNQLELIQKNFINNNICILSGSLGAGKTIVAKKFAETVSLLQMFFGLRPSI